MQGLGVVDARPGCCSVEQCLSGADTRPGCCREEQGLGAAGKSRARTK